MSYSDLRRIALSDPLASTSNPKFVVGGQPSQLYAGDVKMYEWRREKGEMAMIGLRTEIGQIRALAWSPSPSHRHLIATGLSNGRTLIHNVSPATLSLPLGSTEDSPTTIATLSVTHGRSVTSLSFSPVDPNYIATGLERHRSDYSLLIWDIADAIASSSIPIDGDPNWRRPPAEERLNVSSLSAKVSSAAPSEPRHIQHYCPSEHVNCVSFLPNTASHLLASSGNKTIRLFDLRTPTPTLGTNSPRDPHAPAAAGAQQQWLTRAVHGLKVNQDADHLFASFETGSGQGANVVRLWDTRKVGIEVLNFDVAGGGIVGLEWIKGAKGKLGVATREGGIGMWEVLSGTQHDEDKVEEWVTIGGMRQIVKPKQNLHSFAFAPQAHGEGDVIFVVKDGTIGIGPIGSTSALASGSQGQVAISAPSLRVIDPDARLQSSTADGDDIELKSTRDEIEVDESDAPRRNRFQLAPHRVTELLAERSRSSSPAFSHTSRFGASTSIADKRWYEDGPSANAGDGVGLVRGWDGWRRTLGSDVGVVMRRRAMEGYGLDDLLLNAAIATRHPGKERLAGIWEFVDHLTHVMAPRLSSSEEYNLSHQGVYPIWVGVHNEPDHASSTIDPAQSAAMRDPPFAHPHFHGGGAAKGHEPVRQGSAAWTSLKSQSSSPFPHSRQQSAQTPSGRSSPHPSERDRRKTEDVDPVYLEAVTAINARREEAGGLVVPGKLSRHVLNSDRAALRRLILSICGENGQGGKEERNKLAQSGQRTKAAFKAYFAGDEAGTVSILMSSADTQHHLLGSTIAGFMTQSASARGSEFFNSHWPGLVNRVEDPFVRAILCRIGGDEWESVLEEEGIPLLDRIAVGVQHLDDRELSSFLRGRLRKCSTSSSLHMLGITGLSGPSVSLLDRYLSRTGDIQTVSILSALIPPHKLNIAEKECVDRWKEGYRDLLDSWGMWGERCSFDVKWGEVERLLGGDASNGSRAPDKSGSCPVCNNPLTRDTEERLHRKNAMRGTVNVGWPSERTTTCMFCQAPLPRCVICLTHVDPHRPPPKLGDETSHFEHVSDTIDAAYVCCLTCRHGGHANHILPWFEGHDVCPVAGCDCQCAAI